MITETLLVFVLAFLSVAAGHTQVERCENRKAYFFQKKIRNSNYTAKNLKNFFQFGKLGGFYGFFRQIK